MTGVGSGSRPEVPIAEGSLVLLIGPAGAGKSTWAAARFTAREVLSSDAFREMVADDAADQAASADAFRLLHAVARARLARGLRVVVDATNLGPSGRRSLLALAGRTGRPAVAVLFDVPLPVCLARNASRVGRRVSEAVVRRHHAALSPTRARLPSEGYAAILLVGVDGVAVPGS